MQNETNCSTSTVVAVPKPTVRNELIIGCGTSDQMIQQNNKENSMQEHDDTIINDTSNSMQLAKRTESGTKTKTFEPEYVGKCRLTSRR